MVIMNSSSKNKRKGHDESKVSLSRSVVVSPHTSSLSRSGMDCIGRLDSILNLCSSETDPLHDSMAEISTHRAKSFPQKVHTTLEKGDAILQKLQNNIATTNVQVQNESAAAAAKDEQLQKLVRHAECMMEQIATTEEQCDKLSDEIVHYQNLEDTETQVIQSAERKSSARVLRLKKQLALYGNMTGIKWHYAAQELDDRYLFGEVAVPSECRIRHFKIDYKEFSRYELANRLWNMMDVSTHGGNGEWFINFEDDNDSDGSANRGLLLQANGTDLK